jgi:hypothetical protein
MNLYRILAGIFSLLFLLGAILVWVMEIKNRKIEFNDSMRIFCAGVGGGIVLGTYAIRGRFKK